MMLMCEWMMALSSETLNYLRGIAGELVAAEYGGRKSIVARAAAHLGWSNDKVYQQLKSACGWNSGRKKRADCGTTKQDLNALKSVAALQKACIRKNGKQTMHTPLAIAVGKHNDMAISVSASRLNTLMRQRKLDVKTQQQATPAISMRALHPNHVHEVDPSLCLVYYLRGKQHIISDDKLYKNKLDALAKVQFKCWRYVLVDKASGVIVVRYYIGAGESQENMADFLLYAWGKRELAPYHGVPTMLYWDKGSANTAGMVCNMLDALDVKHQTHSTGNARAKGGVEGANNTVETKFECLLKTSPVTDVDALNAAAAVWEVGYNGNLIPNYDSRLRRKGLTRPFARTDLWLLIRDDQLRLLPDTKACRATLEGKTDQRKVKNLRINYKHPRAEKTREYLLGDYDGVCEGEYVNVAPLLYGDCRIVVRVERYDGEPLVYHVEPVPMNGYDLFGQAMDALVMGEENRALPDDASTKAAKALDQRAYPAMNAEAIRKAKNKNTTPLTDIDSIGLVTDIKTPNYMPRRGTVHPLMVDVLHAEPMSRIKAMITIKKALNRPLTAQENAEIRKAYPNGMLPSEVDKWVIKSMAEPALTLVKGGGA